MASGKAVVESDEMMRQNGWLTHYLDSDTLSHESHELSTLVADLQRKLSKHEVQQINSCRSELETLLGQTLQKCQRREITSEDAEGMWKKTKILSLRFCQTALYYQKTFDALQQIGPEYVTAVWGAFKIIFMIPVNIAEIRTNIEDSLERIVSRFFNLRVAAEIWTRPQMTVRVTEAYKKLIEFLKAVLSYYTPNALIRGLKKTFKPWDVKLKPLQMAMDDAVGEVHALSQFYAAGSITQTAQMSAQVLDLSTKIWPTVQMMERRSADGVTINPSQYSELLNDMTRIVDLPRQLTKEQLIQYSNIHLRKANGNFVYATGRQMSASLNDEPLSDFVDLNDASSLLSLRDRVFPDLKSVEEYAFNLRDFARHDVREDSPATSNLLSNERVQSWFDVSGSQLLWLEGFKESGSLQWSTKFSSSVLLAGNLRPDRQSVAVYCTDILRAPQISCPVCTMLQSLIFQALMQNTSRFTSVDTCLNYNLTVTKLQQSKLQLDSLLELFSDIITIIAPPQLYIIVDNIQAISNTDEKLLHELLTWLKRISRTQDSIVKVLITSLEPGLSRRLNKVAGPSTNPDRHVLVKIPRSERSGIARNVMRQSRVRLDDATEDNDVALDVEHLAQRVLDGSFYEDRDSEDDGGLVVSSMKCRSRSDSEASESEDELHSEIKALMVESSITLGREDSDDSDDSDDALNLHDNPSAREFKPGKMSMRYDSDDSESEGGNDIARITKQIEQADQRQAEAEMMQHLSMLQKDREDDEE